MDVEMSSKIDTSDLEMQIHRVMKFGRRTLHQQSVTSAAFVVRDAQDNTPAEEVGQIDRDLAVEVTGYTKAGKRSKAKKPAIQKVTSVKGAVAIGVMITMARGTVGSKFNQLTGSRWALTDRPGAGPGYRQRIAAWITANLQKMTMARHSSTHFLQHGWAEPFRAFINDPGYYGGRSKAQSNAQQKVGNGNRLNFNELGEHEIKINGDSVEVSGTNAVGSDGNAVLAAVHRDALIRKATGPLKAAVNKERGSLVAYCEKKMFETCKTELSDLQ